jgi:hypothetical protein
MWKLRGTGVDLRASRMARGVRKLTVSTTHPDCRTWEWQCNADCAANMAIQTVQGASWVLSSVVHISLKTLAGVGM